METSPPHEAISEDYLTCDTAASLAFPRHRHRHSSPEPPRPKRPDEIEPDLANSRLRTSEREWIIEVIIFHFSDSLLAYYLAC